MAKATPNVTLDQMLDYLKNNVTQIFACNAQPTNYTEASSTFALAGVPGLSSTNFTGPVAGDVSGRKVTLNAITGDTVDTTGTANHIALTSASVLLYVTTCTAQALTAGNTLDYGAWKVEVAAPT